VSHPREKPFKVANRGKWDTRQVDFAAVLAQKTFRILTVNGFLVENFTPLLREFFALFAGFVRDRAVNP
jgi:hypothetical protein